MAFGKDLSINSALLTLRTSYGGSEPILSVEIKAKGYFVRCIIGHVAFFKNEYSR
jgi:hypothetical protein